MQSIAFGLRTAARARRWCAVAAGLAAWCGLAAAAEHGPGSARMREPGLAVGPRLGAREAPRLPAGSLVRVVHPNGQLQRVAFQTPEGETAFAEFTTRGELRSLHCADRPLLGPVVDDARLCAFTVPTSQLTFMAENGMVRARGTWQAGHRIRYETFQDNGMPAQQEEATATTRVERSFGADGTRRREVVWTLAPGGQAVREREQEFASNGVLMRERRYGQGVLVSEATFYLNGRPRSQAQYTMAGGTRMLETREFYDNGVLSADGRYIDTGRYAPTPTGLHRQFDLQGRIKSESLFDARGRVLRERSWKPSGELARDDEVLEDGSRRAWANAASAR